ncbi:hypothetical protein SARC_04073 [Sphaeroforma arctica JP610]|uniref:Uncharacterized protein n=1 Tax=Sphaeroforma arctica JP610 TaxID=667725 RepID=A0A0L0G3Q3_9EUKA|nr:hypothetical protein SARC_04073 [Sphaeroforma arctica JP610]KNC83675.1 hypothetical protein SARC_04073 [Sphaeroforma arctica JP610]|eukprot:XP_014157577.1 hypothetical protein SARC_04073 [Sphaeroforma arctica JP610]
MTSNNGSGSDHGGFGNGFTSYIDLTGSEPITRVVRHEQGTTSDEPDMPTAVTQMCLLGPIHTIHQANDLKPPPRTEPQKLSTTTTATGNTGGSAIPVQVTEDDHRVSLSMELIREHMFTCGVCTKGVLCSGLELIGCLQRGIHCSIWVRKPLKHPESLLKQPYPSVNQNLNKEP